MSGFERTLQTAADAEGIARLLERTAKRLVGGMWGDASRLMELAQRYRDYAAALRECVPSDEPVAADDQGALL